MEKATGMRFIGGANLGKLKSLTENKLLKNLIIVLGCFAGGIVLLSPFLFSNQWFEGNDFLYHYNVIQAYDSALHSGQFFYKVLPNIANDYGYGTGYFYGTLPAKVTVLVKNLLQCSYFDAIKVTVYLVFSLSAIFMYFFANRVLKNIRKALFASLLYVTFPYYVSNLYVRFAYSEVFICLFIPLVLWGMYELLYLNNGKAFLVLFTIGTTAMVLTHMSIAVWVCLVCLIMILLNFRKFFSESRWLLFLFSCGLILCLTSYYTLALIEHFGAYRVSNPDVMNTAAAKVYEGANFPALYYNQYPLTLPFFSVFPYISAVFYFAIVVFAVRRLKTTKAHNKLIFLENPIVRDDFDRKLMVVFCAIAIFVFLSMTKISVWWFITPSVLRMIQFSSRLLNIFIIMLALLAPSAYKGIKKRKHRKIAVCLTICVISYTSLIFSSFYPTIAYKIVSEENLSTNLVINRGCGDQFEYLPQIADSDYMRERNNVIFENPNDLDVKDLIVQSETCSIRFYLRYTEELESKKIVLKIPYDINLHIVQNAASYLNSNMEKHIIDTIYMDENKVFSDWSHDVEFSMTDDGYVELELENVPSIVRVDYSKSDSLANYFAENPFQFKTVEGNATYSNFEKNGVNYTVDVDVVSKSTIELPTIFYKGYQVELKKADGTVSSVDATMNENGFLEVELEDSGELSVKWVGTNFVKLGKYLVVFGAALFVLMLAVIVFVPKSFWKKARLKQEDRRCKNYQEI